MNKESINLYLSLYKIDQKLNEDAVRGFMPISRSMHMLGGDFGRENCPGSEDESLCSHFVSGVVFLASLLLLV